jgi:predicted DNA binding CopG/RHH family protein
MEEKIHFNSEAEEAKCWDENIEDIPIPDDDLYGELLVSQKLRDDCKLKLTTIRLSQDMINEVKKIADKKAMPYQTLIRSWIAERLTVEHSAPARRMLKIQKGKREHNTNVDSTLSPSVVKFK